MTSAKPDDSPSRDAIQETLISMFVREIGSVGRAEVGPVADFTKDFGVHHEDISIFVTRAVRHFGIPVNARGDFAPTLEGLATFIHDYLRSAEAGPAKEHPRRLLDRLAGWIRL